MCVCVCATYFKHSYIRKYNRVARSRDEMEVKNMKYLALEKRDMLSCVYDERTI